MDRYRLHFKSGNYLDITASSEDNAFEDWCMNYDYTEELNYIELIETGEDYMADRKYDEKRDESLF